MNINSEYTILDTLPSGIAIYNKIGSLVFINNAAKKICKRKIPINLYLLEINKDDLKKLHKGIELITSKNIYYQITVKPINKLKNGCVVEFIDILSNKSLGYLATHDEMTGLYNRNFYETEAERLINSRDYPISVIISDLDNLKKTNDKYGHEAGDKLIISTGIILKQCLRKYDILARIGGDEFLILLPKTNEATVKKVVNRINTKINLLNKKRKKIKIGLSVGYSISDKASDLKKAIKQADKEMYQIKLSHKG